VPRLVLLTALSLACATTSGGSSDGSEPTGRTSCTPGASDDLNVYDTTQVSERPYARSGPDLEYPVRLRERHVQGRVLLSLIVNADGSVDPTSITVVRSADPGFDVEAIRWARGGQFWPGCRQGRAVRVRMLQPIDFKIRP